MQGQRPNDQSPPPQQVIASVWDSQQPQQQQQQQQYQQPFQQQYQQQFPQHGIPMGGFYPKTSASTALGLSIAGLALGLLCFPLCGLLAVPGVFMARSSAVVTRSMPGHPDANTAKTAEILGWITLGLMVLAFMGFVALIMLDESVLV
jgi:hypothetical protein